MHENMFLKNIHCNPTPRSPRIPACPRPSTRPARTRTSTTRCAGGRTWPGRRGPSDTYSTRSTGTESTGGCSRRRRRKGTPNRVQAGHRRKSDRLPGNRECLKFEKKSLYFSDRVELTLDFACSSSEQNTGFFWYRQLVLHLFYFIFAIWSFMSPRLSRIW